MEIKLKKLVLSNFKGIRSFEMNLFGNETDVYGANGTGKTTIFDAFLWLLFDKDSTGRKDFEIKTLTSEGKTIKDLEHSVEGTFEIDGTNIILKKIYREKWVRKRGFTNEEFTGNETTYFWNNVPVKKEDYTTKIVDVICDENTFRLLSDVRYFNSLTWQQRRQLLFSLVDESSIIPNSIELQERLKGKTTDELRRELAASKKKLLAEIDQIPIRIDEIHRRLPEYQKVPPSAKIVNELNSIKKKLLSQVEASNEFTVKISELNSRKSELLSKIDDKKFYLKQLFRKSLQEDENLLIELKNELTAHQRKEQTMQSELSDIEKMIDRKKLQLTKLREEYRIEEATKFSSKLECPTCGTPFNEDRKKALIENFNENKSSKLELINIEGLNLKKEVTELNKSKEHLQNSIASLTSLELQLQQQIVDASLLLEVKKSNLNEQYSKDCESDAEIEEINSAISKIDSELRGLTTIPDNSDILKKEAELLSRRDEIRDIESSNKSRDEQLKRIDELEASRLTQLNILSSIEKLEFELSAFVMERVKNIEQQLKVLFDGIDFKMFDLQINGGLTDTCVVQRDGVPYSDLNTASKIWVSLRIINTFSRIKNIFTPIFIDNRESVSVIPEMKNQVISLFVAENYSKLTLK